MPNSRHERFTVRMVPSQASTATWLDMESSTARSNSSRVRASNSARLRSVMLYESPSTPTGVPWPSRMRRTRASIQTTDPSFRTSSNSPFHSVPAVRLTISAATQERRGSGYRSAYGRPSISAADQPNRRVAPSFQ